MHVINVSNYKSVYGELIIGSINDKLCICDWKYRKMRNQIDLRILNYFKSDFKEKDTSLNLETIKQLEEYFALKRKDFDLPIEFAGTQFQKNVWNKLLKIPYGKTESYLSLSEKIGDKNAVRAVASANGANAISIIVPCHRVIGSDGKLTGYAGGIAVKKKLLEQEGVQLISNQYRLF